MATVKIRRVVVQEDEAELAVGRIYRITFEHRAAVVDIEGTYVGMLDGQVFMRDARARYRHGPADKVQYVVPLDGPLAAEPRPSGPRQSSGAASSAACSTSPAATESTVPPPSMRRHVGRAIE